MDLAIGRERIIELDAVSYAPAVDEDHDVAAQMSLVIQHVAAQGRRRREGLLQRVAQQQCGRFDFRHRSEAAQLLSEHNRRHEGKLYKAGSARPHLLPRANQIMGIVAGVPITRWKTRFYGA